MALASTPRSYGSAARAFHWLTAIIVLSALALGLYAKAQPQGSEAEVARLAQVYSLHKALGLAAFVTALARILWALSEMRPGPVHPDRRVETFVVAAVHWTLYGALVVMPLSGWMTHAATEGFAPIPWPFGQDLPFVPDSPALADRLAWIHAASSKLLIAALILHVAGALKHAVIDRDGTLARIVTGRAAGPGTHRAPRLPPGVAVLAWAAAIGAGLALAPPPAAVTGPTTAGGNWAVTAGTLGFTIRQMTAEVRGAFTGWSAEITYDDEARTGHVTVTIPIEGMTIGSVTPQARGPEFFDLARHPTATFDADIADSGGGLAATGTLRIRGRDVPVTLPFTLAIDGDTARARGEVTLDRRDFGMGPSFPGEASIGFPVGVAFDLTAARR